MPMTRGMQSTCYVKLAGGADVQQLRQRLEVRNLLNLPFHDVALSKHCFALSNALPFTAAVESFTDLREKLGVQSVHSVELEHHC